MEVGFIARLFIAAFAAVIFSSCNESPKFQQATGFQDVSSQCASVAIKNSFVVYWKDGSVSVEKAENKDEFMEKIMTPHEDEIQFAEHDMILRRPQEPVVVDDGASFSAKAVLPTDWGQQRIEAPAAWAQGILGKGVIVAVIDSGVDLKHVQLANQLAYNTKEIPNNGRDDDGNGLIDDAVGYDFFNKTGDVVDGSGHGTHVSGIILADHSTGNIKGVAPQARLLPLRFMNNEGMGTVSGAVQAVRYAADRGARVINASWGAEACSTALKQAIFDVEEKGVLFLAAAGNNGSNLDYYPEFPAAFNLANQLTIGASTYHEARASFSNYSYTYVHLMAPGQDIVSTYPNFSNPAGVSNLVKKMDGTSMATPFVAGVAAELFSFRPNATVEQIRAAILAGVDRDPREPNGTYPVVTGGRINLRKSIEELARVLP